MSTDIIECPISPQPSTSNKEVAAIPSASSPKIFNNSMYYRESQYSPIEESLPNTEVDNSSHEALDLSKKPNESTSLNDSCLTSAGEDEDDHMIDKMDTDDMVMEDILMDDDLNDDYEEHNCENESLNDSGLPHLDLPPAAASMMPTVAVSVNNELRAPFNLPRSLDPSAMAFPSPLSHLRNTLNASNFFPPPHHPQFNLGLPEQNMVCVECRKTFRFEKNFLRHMQKAHSTGEAESVLKCKLCNYTTKHYSNMYVHIRTHTGDKPYFCAGCGANFTQGSSLKLHIKSRHADKAGYFCLTKKPGKNNLTKLWTRVLKKDLHKFTNMHSNSIYPHNFNLMAAPGPPVNDPMANQRGPLGGLPWQQGNPSLYNQAAANILANHGFPTGSRVGPPFPPMGHQNISPSHRHQGGRDIVNLFPFHNVPQQRHGDAFPMNPFFNAHQMLLNNRGLPSLSPAGFFPSMDKLETENSMENLRRKSLESQYSANHLNNDSRIISDSQTEEQSASTNLSPSLANRSVNDLSSEFSVIQKRLRGIIDQLQLQSPNALSDTDPVLRRQLLSLLEIPGESSSHPGPSPTLSSSAPVTDNNTLADASSSSSGPASPIKTPKLSDKSGTDHDLKIDANRLLLGQEQTPEERTAGVSTMSHFVLPHPGLFSPSSTASKQSHLFQASPVGSGSFSFPFPMSDNPHRSGPTRPHSATQMLGQNISPQGMPPHPQHQFNPAQALNGLMIPPMNLPFPPLHSSILRS